MLTVWGLTIVHNSAGYLRNTRFDLYLIYIRWFGPEVYQVVLVSFESLFKLTLRIGLFKIRQIHQMSVVVFSSYYQPISFYNN